jgi:retron-type reverse transcriptase
LDQTAEEKGMKRHGGLFAKVAAFETLLTAARRAQSCKRFRDDVLAFNYDLESNLHRLMSELREKTYRPGAYKTFLIYEPKRRFISAAPYRDRIVHHTLCAVIEPLFDKTFLDSCYANRLGGGTHKALDHFVQQARRHRFCLRADVEKYFPSMDHLVLKEKFRRKIKCPETLWLMDLILDNSNEQEPTLHYFAGDTLLTPLERRRGLPIGNLTSQFYANVYLSDLDHVLAARYGGRRYLRYVDDIALFSDDAEELAEARDNLNELLESARLRLHPIKTQITETRAGVNFLGFRVFPDHIRLRQENLRRARRRMRQLQSDYRNGVVSLDNVKQSLQGWNAHAAYGDTWRLRERVFSSLVFSRS